MSIGDLMFVSYILFAAAVVFLVAAVVMFFKFDIRRIYKILKSAANPQSATPKTPAVKELAAKTEAAKTEVAGTVALPADFDKSEAVKALDLCVETVPLPENQMPEQDFAQEYERTLPLETIKFMLIQDITYIYDSTDQLA